MSLILPTEELISQLSTSVVIISEMPEMMSSDVEMTDVLTFADIQISSNFNISFKDFERTVFENILNGDLQIIGNWVFSDKNGGSLSIETSSIVNENSLVNREYFEKNILSKIDELSNYIYKSPHVPSHVGEIIASLKFADENSVRQVYGQDTRWQKISGRIIIGVGSPSENTVEKFGSLVGSYSIGLGATGGTAFEDLGTSNIPKHTHKFTGEATQIDMSWHWWGNNDNGKIAATKINMSNDHGDPENHEEMKAKIGTLGSIKIEGETSISPASVYGKKLSLAKEIYNTNGSSSTYTKHNNMPPIIYAYLWRRTT